MSRKSSRPSGPRTIPFQMAQQAHFLNVPPKKAPAQQQGEQEQKFTPEQVEQIRNTQAQQRVEAIATQLFIGNLDLSSGEVKREHDDYPDEFDKHISGLIQRCYDTALIFAREAWGIVGRRISPANTNDEVGPPQSVDDVTPEE